MHLISGSRVQANEKEVLWLPRDWDKNSSKNKYGVVYCHGNGDDALSPMDISTKLGQYRFIEAMVEAGFPVLSMDLGRQGVTPNHLNGWGNATVVARLDTAFNYMTGPVGSKDGKIITAGVSMGAVGQFNYAKNNSNKVAGCVSIIPVCDLDDIYQNNRANLRAGVAAAYGIVYPESLPEGANPLTSPGELSEVPVFLSYSTADTVIVPSTVVALAEEINATAVIHSVTLEHSEESILEANMDEITDWMLARK